MCTGGMCACASHSGEIALSESVRLTSHALRACGSASPLSACCYISCHEKRGPCVWSPFAMPHGLLSVPYSRDCHSGRVSLQLAEVKRGRLCQAFERAHTHDISNFEYFMQPLLARPVRAQRSRRLRSTSMAAPGLQLSRTLCSSFCSPRVCARRFCL